MTSVNWTDLFSGFSDVGTALGSFVTNLVVGLLPAIVIIAITLGIVAIIGATIYMVVGMFKKIKHK